MDWFAGRLIDSFNLVARWYHARRYGVLAARLGRGEPSPDQRRGFVVIQVDALAYDYAREAMARGTMPYLRRLVEQEGYRLAEWRTGLPSTTTATQAGIMYGNNWDVPAFRWYEKDQHLSVVSKIPALLNRVQRRVSQGRTGILAGGSSYSNMMDGGAALSLLTIGAISGQRIFANVRGLGWFFLFFLNPVRLARIIAVSLWEYLRNISEDIVSQLRHERRRRVSALATFLEMLINIVVQELVTFGVMLDMYLGVPAIYVNYLGYDEVAHQEGPLHRQSLRVLRRIDNRIREIDRARSRDASRSYDLFILSDHGLAPSVSFKALFGCTLGEYVRTQLGPVSLDEQRSQQPSGKVETQVLLAELEGMEANLSERGKRLTALLRRYLAERLPPDPELGWHLERRGDIVVRDTGPLAHLYFNVTTQPMNVSEIAIIYPGLIPRLVAHPGLGLVVGREEGHAVIITRQGILRLAAQKTLTPDHPLASFSDPDYVAEQLARLAAFPHSGDLILLGAWNGNGETVSFEEHTATHGGIGGSQDRAFLLLPPGLDWDVRGVRNSEALYALFRDGRQSGEAAH